MIAETPPIHARITGWKRLIRCFIETITIAAMVATNVAIIQGMKISVGLCAGGLTAALAAMIVTGINVRPEACRHRNIICAFEALSLLGFIVCKLSIALIPNGVAALSSPKRFAEKFIIISPLAGGFFGNSGKSFEKKGP